MTDAVSLARQTVDEFARIGMSDHPSALDARGTLGEALIALGDRESAARELRLAVAGAQRQFVPGDRRTARLQDALERAVKREPVSSERLL